MKWLPIRKPDCLNGAGDGAAVDGPPRRLKKLQRDGFIKPIGRDIWRLVDLVQGFARATRKPDGAAPVSASAGAASRLRAQLH
jgi:hypothetical protein